ncbi:MAG: hypothetical protein Hals2KO_10380 [Halioglobus sp.]
MRARAGIVTWLCWWLLFLQQALDAALQGAPWFIWLVKLLPLALFLPGMRRDNLRSYIWLCFVCLGYFMILVQRLFVEPASPLLIIGMVAVVLLFIGAMVYVRWRARELREQRERSQLVGESQT